jgi:branched-chain amino acid transport system substrate-binding protein
MKRLLGGLFAVFVSALMVAACSSSSSSNGTTATPASTTKLTGTPIKIMSITTLTQGVPAPEVPQGAEAAVKAINAAGGIKGHPLDYTACDDMNNPDTAANCARTAVSDGDIAVVGDFTQQGSAYLPILLQAHIAVVGLIPATAADFTSTNTFPLAGGAPVGFAGLGYGIGKAGATKVAVARIDLAAASELTALTDAGMSTFGIKGKDVPVPIGAPDMAPYVAASLNGGTNGVVVGLDETDGLNYLKALFQQSPNMKVAMVTTEIPSVAQALGSEANGIILSESFNPSYKGGLTSTYLANMKAAGFSDVTGYRENSWASVRLVAQIASHLSSITAANVLQALSTDTNVVTGVTPPINFTKGGVGGIPRVFNPCQLLTKIENGEEVPITGQFFNPYTGGACPAP